ncbi:MAG: hypothetical protein N4A54_11030 [Peptostreptococcaceae bacterium]|nr:hypothetical protein [Peptostreptococcaceae bacterium]
MSDKKEKLFLYDITEKVTGIDRSDSFFDSARKEVERIINMLKVCRILENDKLEITKGEEDASIKLLKSFYENIELRELLSRSVNSTYKKDNKTKTGKIKKSCMPLNDEEYELLKEHLLQINLENCKDDKEKEQIREYVKEMENEEFYEKIYEAKGIIVKDLNLINDNINSSEAKRYYINKYIDTLNEGLKKFREEIGAISRYEKECNKINYNKQFKEKDIDSFLEASLEAYLKVNGVEVD